MKNNKSNKLSLSSKMMEQLKKDEAIQIKGGNVFHSSDTDNNCTNNGCINNGCTNNGC